MKFLRSEKHDLYNEDLRPFSYKERSISAPSLFVTWFGMSVQLGIFMGAAQLTGLLTVWQVVLAIILGNLICVIISVFAQDIGIKFGLPFAASIRTSFGYLGGHFGGILRMLPSAFFVGLNTWIGASALNEVFRLTLGLDNIWIMVVLFAVVTVLLVFYGAKLVAAMNWIASPLLLIIGIYLVNVLLKTNNATFASVMSMGGTGNPMNMGSFVFGVLAMAGGWASVVLSIQDITRECKTSEDEVKSWVKSNSRYAVAQLFGIIPACTLFGFIGAISMVLTSSSDPVAIITQTVGSQNMFVAILCQMFVVLAMLSTTSGANLLGSAYVLCNLVPSKLNLRKSAVVIMIFSLVIQPWRLMGTMMPVLSVMGSALGPVTSIMIIDYYVIRKRNINLDDLYTSKGKYRYANGFNPAAFIAYVVGVGVSAFSMNYMYAISMVVGGIVYYILMKYWISEKIPSSFESIESLQS